MQQPARRQDKGIPRLALVGVTCISCVLSIANAYALATSFVSVNESPGGYHDLTDAGPSSSFASLSYLLGSSWSEVDIATGTLRTFVQTSTSDVVDPAGATVSAYAHIDDMFTVSGLPDTGISTGIISTLTVSGHLVTPPRAAFSHYSSVFADLAAEQYQLELWPFPDGGELNVNIVLSHQYAVFPDVPFRVLVTLQSAGQGFNDYDILSDFSATASLGFELPPGTSITSTGGFFQAAVPIPAAWILLSSGLLGVAGFRRLRDRDEMPD